MKPARRSIALLVFILAGFLFVPLFSQNTPDTHTSDIKLAFLGDIMLGRGIDSVYSDNQPPTWEESLSDLSIPLKEVDIVAANLESPLTHDESLLSRIAVPEQKNQYNLCAPSQAVSALESAGIDIVSLANNHHQDCGPKSLSETSRILKDANIDYLQPDLPFSLSTRQYNLTFLAYDDVSSSMNIDVASEQIKQAYQQGTLVIVSVHWGKEYLTQPDERQRKISQRMADSGAAIIWGHHPHVTQPVEWIQGDNIPYPTLVAYSLGNALFDQTYPKTLRESFILVATINHEGVHSYETIPIEIRLPEFKTGLSPKK